MAGDSPLSDIAGADTFGIDSARSDPRGEQPDSRAVTYRLTSLWQLLDLAPVNPDITSGSSFLIADR